MGVFDEIGKKLVDGSQGVVQKTKDTAEMMKINSMISDEEKRITALYTDIGKTYFEQHADSCEALLQARVDAVKAAKAKIAEYEERVRRLKGTVRCPNCNNEIPYGAQFCNCCGLRINAQGAAEAAANTPRCVKCGMPLAANVTFCTNCGTRVAATPAPIAEATPAPVAEPAPQAPVCANCGSTLEPGALFCVECGAKISG